MLYMKSTNSNDGSLKTEVSFEVGSDLDMDERPRPEPSGAVDAFMPQSVKDYGVTVKKSLSFPLALISLYSPNGTYDAVFIGELRGNINITDPLKRDPWRRRRDDLRRLGLRDAHLGEAGRARQARLTVTDVKTRSQKQNTVNPAGQIGGRALPPGQEFTYTVKRAGAAPHAEEFGGIVVRSNPDGSQVRLRDVARIELGSQTLQPEGPSERQARGHPRRLPDPRLERARRRDGCGSGPWRRRADASRRTSTTMSLDTTEPITEGISEIVHTLFEAVVLVILVVFVFLQSWRATLIPLLTVPVSLIGDFAVFPILGFSINTLSLFGLVLAIGIVVDDAIVVVEAVSTTSSRGSRRTATLKAMEEVSGPGRRDRPRPLGGVHPGRLHGRHHRAGSTSSSRSRSRSRSHLGGQRPHAQPALAAML
jgi:hydrophobic/amphiphilic exporter-1 (mainly G- bacteria), HAE1 family